MKRGDIVTVALQGDLGKPRPAVVVQTDWVDETTTVLVCPMTGTIRDAPIYRLLVPADSRTGLTRPSQIMADKIVAIRRDKCGPVIGSLNETTLAVLGRMLALMTGIAG